MNKILVTGYSGFVGIRLLNYLKTLNTEIVLLGRKKIGLFKHYKCDFLINDIPKEAFSGVDAIFHLAAHTHDLSLKKDNKKYNQLNINLTKEIINLCLLNSVKKFIYLSSTKVYKRNNINLISENSPEDTDEIYGISKLESEKYIKKISSENINFKYLIIRSPLVYGPNVKGNLKIMQNAIRLRIMPPLPFFKNKKSLIHVDDLVRSLCLFIKNENCLNNTFIVTDGHTYSTNEIYEIICMINGIKSKKIFGASLIYKTLISFPFIKFRLQKLFSNEHFSNKLINKYGFKPSKLLHDMNETSF